MRRRDCLFWAGASALVLPQAQACPAAPLLAAAWSLGGQQQLGVLRVQAGRAEIAAAVDLPTRAHGLLAESNGTLLAVARRPGDWLLRWRADGRVLARHWIEPQRCFNGHLLLSRDGRRLFSSETDLDSGQGLIGVRDAASLEKLAEWPTQGLDAHQLLLDGDDHLLVANGGLAMPLESGRLKLRRAEMDASLVRLDGRSGAPLGQWRLADARLSPRHLAWGGAVAGGRRVLGIALQAEHDDAAARAAAPVLALFRGERLTACPQPAGVSLAGYGGDIAFDGMRWAVSCPRIGTLAWWQADGRWLGVQPAACACALTSDAQALWSGGNLLDRWRAGRSDGQVRLPEAELRLDNHWLRLPPSASTV